MSKDKGVKSLPDDCHKGVEGQQFLGCMKLSMYVYGTLNIGCWFGVKGDEKLGVFMCGVKQCDLSAVVIWTSAENLSQDLLEICTLFCAPVLSSPWHKAVPLNLEGETYRSWTIKGYMPLGVSYDNFMILEAKLKSIQMEGYQGEEDKCLL